MKRRGARILPHTADLRLEVRCGDLPGLFAESVAAMYSLLTDRRKVRARERRVLRASGEDPGELLFLLLREALLLHSVERFLVRGARGTMDSYGMSVEVAGEVMDPSRHLLYREIKAVTAHAIAVERSPEGCLARFVLDV